MGRFDNLDDALRRELALQANAQLSVQQHLERLRAEHEGTISNWLQIVGEYYNAIKFPYAEKNGATLGRVAQYKKPTQGDSTQRMQEKMMWGDTQFLYAIGLVPSRFPYAHTYDNGHDYRSGELRERPGRNPNVAMLFELSLTDKIDRQTKDIVGLEPSVHVTVWGRFMPQEGEIMPANVRIGGVGSAYDKWYTGFFVDAAWDKPEETAAGIEWVLRAVAPHVVDHQNIIKGISPLK